MSDFSLSYAKLKKRESSIFIINILKCFFSEWYIHLSSMLYDILHELANLFVFKELKNIFLLGLGKNQTTGMGLDNYVGIKWLLY